MTSEEIRALVKQVREGRAEFRSVEVKSASINVPERLWHTMSAFANADGGVILFGLDETQGFAAIGVRDVQKTQAQIGDQAHQMVPALFPRIDVAQMEGKQVVAMQTDAVSPHHRPCYFGPKGFALGSFMRVGNTNRQMSEQELLQCLSARSHHAFDVEPCLDATVDDLDQGRLDSYVANVRSERDSKLLSRSRPELLEQLGIAAAVDNVLRPTLAGSLVFGKYPQAAERQLTVTCIHYFGTDPDEEGPEGERFVDDRCCEGPIPDMIEDALNWVVLNVRKGAVVQDLRRRDTLEYPKVAVREALVNAVAHRDYGPGARGTYIQVRLFADRLEIESPGGLYGNVTFETIGSKYSTRNGTLMRLLADLHLAENRGTGVRAMTRAMEDANLEPPQFSDGRMSFQVTFTNRNLIDPAALDWIRQFADTDLSVPQKRALAHVSMHSRITNREYRELGDVDELTARSELRALTDLGLMQKRGSRRGTHYILTEDLRRGAPRQQEAGEDRVLAYVRKHGSIQRAQCADLLDIEPRKASRLLQRMRDQGLLRQQGQRKSATYHIP